MLLQRVETWMYTCYYNLCTASIKSEEFTKASKVSSREVHVKLPRVRYFVFTLNFNTCYHPSHDSGFTT